MKKTFFSIFFLLLLLLTPVCAVRADSAVGTPAFDLSGSSVLLYNVNTDQVIYQKNSDAQLDMTGLSQIMTALVTIDRVKDLDNTIFTARSVLYDNLYGMDYPTADVRQGEELSVRELLYCMMIQNSYEAAEILGDCISEGSEAYFAEMMNKKAAELGMTHTKFTNASGRDDTGQYSTAEDLLLLIKAAMKQPVIAAMAATTEHTVPANNVHSESRLLIASNRIINSGNSTYYFDGANGLKCVGSEDAGRCGLFSATRDGMTYYCVILNAPVYDKKGEYISENGALTDAGKLFSWAFSNYSYKSLVNIKDPCAQIQVTLSSDTDYILLYPKESYSQIVPNEVDETSVGLRPVIPDSIEAPVKSGQEIGYVELILSDQVIGKVPLIAKTEVKRSQILYIGKIMKDIFFSVWACIVYVLLFLLLVAYICLVIWRNRQRKKHPSIVRSRTSSADKSVMLKRKRIKAAKKQHGTHEKEE